MFRKFTRTQLVLVIAWSIFEYFVPYAATKIGIEISMYIQMFILVKAAFLLGAI